MSISADYTRAALNQINAHKKRVELVSDNKRNELHIKYPLLKEYDKQIYSLYLNAAKGALEGKKADFESISAKSLELQKNREEFLNSVNVTPESLLPEYDCNRCSDSGYCGGKLCECVKKLAVKMMFDELNKDVPLEKCTFDNFDLTKYSEKSDKSGASPSQTMQQIYNYCIKYAAGFNEHSKSLFFYGKTGVGKTHLSLAIANEAIKKGYSVIYGPINRLLGNVQNEYFSKEQNSNKTLDAMLNCDLLILDDLGTEFKSTFITSAVYDIVNSRILSNKPVIINTNLDIYELEEKYSQRIISRIFGCYKMYQFIGNDNRTN